MGLNSSTVGRGHSEDEAAIQLLSWDQESCHHITLHSDISRGRKRKGRDNFNYCPVYGASMDKHYDICWQNHYYFSLEAIFPFPFSWRKCPHGDYPLKKHSNQSLNTWSARGSTRACSGICSTAQGPGHLGLPGRQLCQVRYWEHKALCLLGSVPSKIVLPSEAFRAQSCFLQNPSSQHLSWLWGIFCKLCVH